MSDDQNIGDEGRDEPSRINAPRKTRSPIGIIAVIVILLAGGGAAFYYLRAHKTPGNTAATQPGSGAAGPGVSSSNPLAVAQPISPGATTPPTPTPTPTTGAPTPQPPLPPGHQAVVPPGMHVLTVGDHSVYCAAADDQWASAAMSNLKPTTRPTTMPSDVLDNIQRSRAALISQIVGDLVLSDDKAVANVIDTKLIPNLNKLQQLTPVTYYLPASEKDVAALMKAGWRDPRFYYNRIDDGIHYNPMVSLSAETPADDCVMWVPLEDNATPAAKTDALHKAIEQFDQQLLDVKSQRAIISTRAELQDLIRTQVWAPLKLPAALNWLGDGIAVNLSVKYTAQLTGFDRAVMMKAGLEDHHQNQLDSNGLDLNNPIDPATIRKDLLPYYIDAAGHKGAAVVDYWMTTGGDAVVTKAMVALRAHPPANPAALVKLIKDATGIDLQEKLSPHYIADPRPAPPAAAP